MLSRETLYDAGIGEGEDPIELRAGPLTINFEPDTAFLRPIVWEDHEVLRGIYAAVRDHNWNTIPTTVHDLELQRTARAFTLTFAVDAVETPVDFRWVGRIEGDSDGTVRYEMKGEAHSAFRRNRIGFCVLHPPSCAGEPCHLTKTNGDNVESSFPDAIAPHQPFKDLRAITHPVAEDRRLRVEFEGEIFETEDQRNWTDASFKTYCTPLAEPFPVAVDVGDTVEQAVTVRLLQSDTEDTSGNVSSSRQIDASARGRPWHTLSLDPNPEYVPLPSLGAELTNPSALDRTRKRRLGEIGLDHIRLELRPDQDNWKERLRRGSDLAREHGLDLELPLFLTDDADVELEAVVDHLEAESPPLARVLILHEEQKVPADRWPRLARQKLVPSLDGAALISGTDCFFTELNRNRPDSEPLDGVCYSLNPQVHAFDNRSIVETLQVQADTVWSTRRFMEDLPVVVSPVTLRPRFNPNATGPEPEPEPGELPDSVDPRQMSLFAAAWTTGSLHALCATGASALTYYEVTGWRGLMEGTDGSPLPDKFPAVEGGVFPLYHVLSDVADFAGGDLLPLQSSRPLAVTGFVLRNDVTSRVLLANLTGEVQVVQIDLPASPPRVRLRPLDETTAETAMRKPGAFRNRSGQERETEEGRLRVSLLPFGVNRIDPVK